MGEVGDAALFLSGGYGSPGSTFGLHLHLLLGRGGGSFPIRPSPIPHWPRRAGMPPYFSYVASTGIVGRDGLAIADRW